MIALPGEFRDFVFFFFVGGGDGEDGGMLEMNVEIFLWRFRLGVVTFVWVQSRESRFQWNLGLYFVDARFSPVNGVITPLSID